MRKIIMLYLLFSLPSAIAACAKDEIKTVKEKRTIKYKVTKAEDPEMPEGKSQVKQEGVNGEQTVIYEVTFRGGREHARRVKKRTVSKKPRDEILLVGTLKTEVKQEVIPAETQYVIDKKLARGDSFMKRPGVSGMSENVYEVGYRRGVEVSRRLVKQTVTKEPVPAILAVGSMPTPLI